MPKGHTHTIPDGIQGERYRRVLWSVWHLQGSFDTCVPSISTLMHSDQNAKEILPPVARWPEQNLSVERWINVHVRRVKRFNFALVFYLLPLSVSLYSCIWSGRCWSLWSLIRAAQRRLCAVVWRVRPSWILRSSIANHSSTLICSTSVVKNRLNGSSP